jgi:hypothetical protein
VYCRISIASLVCESMVHQQASPSSLYKYRWCKLGSWERNMISVNAKPTIHDPAVGLRCGAGGVMTPPGPPAWCSAPLPRNGGCRAEESPFPLSSGSKSSMVRGFWQSLDFPGYFVYMYFVQVDPNWPSSNKGPSTREQTVFAFRGQCSASVLVAPTAIVRRAETSWLVCP